MKTLLEVWDSNKTSQLNYLLKFLLKMLKISILSLLAFKIYDCSRPRLYSKRFLDFFVISRTIFHLPELIQVLFAYFWRHFLCKLHQLSSPNLQVRNVSRLDRQVHFRTLLKISKVKKYVEHSNYKKTYSDLFDWVLSFKHQNYWLKI